MYNLDPMLISEIPSKIKLIYHIFSPIKYVCCTITLAQKSPILSMHSYT